MNQGTLFVVATPIGNVGDITDRAKLVLGECDKILAEDTRMTKKLLEQFSISTPCEAVHNHNERDKVADVARWLSEGKNLALVSDAGTPLISDPGYPIVTQLRDLGFSVVPIPGASALTAALSVSGLPTDRFCFEGFLSSKAQGRRQRLSELSYERRTMVFYEAPHRLLNTVKCMVDIFGSTRKISLCRELTKTFETIWTGNVSDLVEFIDSDSNQQRGESVLVLAGREESGKQDDLTDEDRNLLSLLLTELPLKKASVIAAKYTGKAKKVFYQWGVETQGN